MTRILFRGFEQYRLQFRLVHLFTNAVFKLNLSVFVISLLLLLPKYHVAHVNYALKRPTNVLKLEKGTVSASTKFHQIQLTWVPLLDSKA